MNRKQFVGNSLGMLMASPWISRRSESETISIVSFTGPAIMPPFLQKGDCIGITSPAGSITREDIQPAIDQLQLWGYQVRVGEAIGKKDFTFGGTDAERLSDFQSMLDDPKIKAILCARGGYGLVRIIDRLNFDKFVSHPKWILGFSDVCILHAHIHQQFGIATIHSKMCNSFLKEKNQMSPEQLASIHSINDCLKGNEVTIQIGPHRHNRQGKANGILVGGNLRIMENLSGSSSDLHTAGKMLFLEDTEEYLYNIDRMFWSLKRSGKLKDLKGLIVGGFKVKPDDPGEEFGMTLEQIVLEKVKEYDYPVCFNFPVGHQKHNMALVCGAEYELSVEVDGVSLKKMDYK